ncbi:MAG: YihY/virulence factor BrkB family protein [bacterium]
MNRFKIIRKASRLCSIPLLKKFIEFFKYYVITLLVRADSRHIYLTGAGVSFSLLLSVIPLVLLVFSILGSIIGIDVIQENVAKLIDMIIPYKQYAEYTKQAILSRITGVIEYTTIAGFVGGIGLFFTATWLFTSLRTILNNIFGVSVKKSFLIGMLRDFGMVILILIFMLLYTFILPMFSILINFAERFEFLRFLRFSDFMNLLLSISSILVIFLMFFSFYYLIPYERLGKRVALFAAFWATLFWEVARNIFGHYVRIFMSDNQIYGAFVLIIVVLFWIFYSACLFILGAELAQLYREKRNQKKISEIVTEPGNKRS